MISNNIFTRAWINFFYLVKSFQLRPSNTNNSIYY